MLKFILYPFAVLFNIITMIRNYLYDTGKFTSLQFNEPVINIGNLTVGGTGKSPHVEYLIRLLKDKYKVSTLSRGYGRKTKGFILASDDDTSSSLGDEPMQFYTKFKKDIHVCVGENRITSIPSIILNTETQVILLDDAFQHRAVKPHLNILLSDYNRPFYNDLILPAGRLRENRKGAKRADIIIVSKCPDNISEQERVDIEKEIKKYTLENTPVFFSSVKYGKPYSFMDHKEMNSIPNNVYLLTGIANAKPLKKYVSDNYNLLFHDDKRDHFSYNYNSIYAVIENFKKFNEENKCILTTEKDAVKLHFSEFEDLIGDVLIYYMPIEIYLLDKKEKFEEIVINSIQKIRDNN